MAGSAAEQLEAVMLESDVVHLHVIHSYFLQTSYLFDLIVRLKKPLVWTLHDHWAMTGRCAQPDDCTQWAKGCPSCPNLRAYPPAKLDLASKRWEERRDGIARLQASVPTAIVPCADWLAIDAEKSGLRNIQVIKNSVDRTYWEATRSIAKSPNRPRSNVGQGNIFICRDLRDRSKVDWKLLERLAGIPGQRLTIVGDHAPTLIPGVEYIPATSDRFELAQILSDHDRLIFTSTVDYYPLTIAEALTAGLKVFAISSRASQEFETSHLVELFDTGYSLLESVRSLTGAQQEDDALRPGIDFFNPDRMVDEYLELYEGMS
ncbi:colanic acid biosynthesis glycosyltransferase WcaC [Arthrobacter oryzae]|uniref:colanic acid biosynthesis glycosyltransferase WcaC n=1 Tax=Arthrobacter oryzae TaxID=409290 RepID=UPI002787E057|nr:putative colanic acid biosynthesis glycosyltransferase [Arthrobacter oryzae]